MTIRDLPSLKSFLRSISLPPIFGAGVYAFDRLGLEEIIPDYKLLALRYSDDTRLIEKDLDVWSLERGVGNRHINAPRNSATLLSHERTRAYLAQFPKPALVVYKSSLQIERLAREHGWTIVGIPTRFGKDLFENKALFRTVLEGLGLPSPTGELCPIGWLNFVKTKQRFALPFVLQHPKRGGGKGTFFIHTKHDWDKALAQLKVYENEKHTAPYVGGPTPHIRYEQETEIIAAQYIDGPSISITGCVTRHGVLSTSPQYQIIDAPDLYSPQKGSGLFCGHDWSSSRFTPAVEEQIYAAVEKVGNHLASKGYKGIFGLDFVLDENTQKLFITECNPRLLGSFPTLTMAQLHNEEPPIIAFHLLEHLNIPYAMDVRAVNALMRKPKMGGQMFPHNLTGQWVRSGAEVRAGIYRFDHSDALEFLREGYALKHLHDANEFVLTDGVLQKGAHYSPNRRLERILTLGPLLAENKKTLTPHAQQIARAVHGAFHLKPVPFARAIRFFFPSFMAKG